MDKGKNLTQFINHLLTFNHQYEYLKKNNQNLNGMPFRFNINGNIMVKLANYAHEILDNERNILQIEAPVYVYGDIHGQYQDLIRFLEMTDVPPKSKLLFLGDYVDRGKNSIEVLALLFALKMKYPNHVYMIRGNHECPEVNANYGFLQECMERYSPEEAPLVYSACNKAMMSLPLAAVINEKIFCVHGGLSPNLHNIKQIEKIKRQVTIPNEGLLCDLLWSDPRSSNKEWSFNDRGVSYTFNEHAIDKFLELNNLELICRAHQMITTGYRFFNDNKLVTVFSAPNYCGSCGNDGAVMKITEDLECSFIIIKPVN